MEMDVLFSCLLTNHAGGDPNALSIKIVAPDGNEVFFKIKKTTRLNKLKVSHGGCGFSQAFRTEQGRDNEVEK